MHVMEYCSKGRKRRGGFMKAGKQLIPFYRSTPKSAQHCTSSSSSSSSTATTTTVIGCSSKVAVLKPNISTASSSSSSSLPAHKLVSFVNEPDQTSDHHLLHHAGTGDLQVDAKAATYISAVQERFKMERINSDREHEAAAPRFASHH